jgi:hypothetical protein
MQEGRSSEKHYIRKTLSSQVKSVCLCICDAGRWPSRPREREGSRQNLGTQLLIAFIALGGEKMKFPNHRDCWSAIKP